MYKLKLLRKGAFKHLIRLKFINNMWNLKVIDTIHAIVLNI